MQVREEAVAEAIDVSVLREIQRPGQHDLWAGRCRNEHARFGWDRVFLRRDKTVDTEPKPGHEREDQDDRERPSHALPHTAGKYRCVSGRMRFQFGRRTSSLSSTPVDV